MSLTIWIRDTAIRIYRLLVPVLARWSRGGALSVAAPVTSFRLLILRLSAGWPVSVNRLGSVTSPAQGAGFDGTSGAIAQRGASFPFGLLHG